MYMRIFTTAFLVLSISLTALSQHINSGKSEVNFEVGNLGFNTVDGRFKKMDGMIVFNPNDLSSASFNVCLDASMIDTKNKKRDDHLKNEDFFSVEKYPEICFKSESITKQKESYLVKGKLTMCGVTKLIEIPFTYISKTFSGSFTINRYDYNVGTSTSKFMVSEDVAITIVCVVE